MAKDSVKKFLREPVLHFVLLGAGLFAAHSLWYANDEMPRDAIVISAGRVAQLSALFERTWQRPPTNEERDGLIDDFIREEVAYRESIAAGLDRDDTIIRRRMRQKLEFVAEDLARQVTPSEAELTAYLEENPDVFRLEPRLSFRHVFLDPEKHGDRIETDAQALLTTLVADPTIDAREIGDRILLEHGYADLSRQSIASLLGAPFADEALELEPGTWQGPLASAYGMHLIRVDERTPGGLPQLDDVRSLVLREWHNTRRIEAIDGFYQALIEKYNITIELPDPDGADRTQ